MAVSYERGPRYPCRAFFIITTMSALCAPPQRLPPFSLRIPSSPRPKLLISILSSAGDFPSLEEPQDEKARVRLAPALHEILVVRHQALRPMPGAGALWGSFLYFVGDLNRLEELDAAGVRLVASGVQCELHRRVTDREHIVELSGKDPCRKLAIVLRWPLVPAENSPTVPHNRRLPVLF